MKTLYQRVNFTLPSSTVEVLERVVGKGVRSQFVDQALQEYVKKIGKRKLHALLKESAREQAAEDLRIAAEWFPLEEEAWLRARA